MNVGVRCEPMARHVDYWSAALYSIRKSSRQFRENFPNDLCFRLATAGRVWRPNALLPRKEMLATKAGFCRLCRIAKMTAMRSEVGVALLRFQNLTVVVMNNKNLLRALFAAGLFGAAGFAMAHGDVTPQKVETKGLASLGEEWLDENPYREPSEFHDRAIQIGSSAYNQNCARCHGLEAISGGIAPDLRELEANIDGDDWYKERVINGAVRDGAVYMPRMADYLSQEALWAIRTYIESEAAKQ